MSAEIVSLAGATMRFPLPADARYSYAQRYGADHHGTDIFAPRGTPVLAVVDGRLECRVEPKGGKVCYLTGADGTRYYYAHLDSYEYEQATVRQGDVIGTVGSTGNAAGKAPHLHFQIGPGGRGTHVDPYPLLRAADPHARGRSSDAPLSPWAWLGLLYLLSRHG